jgi:hypothetical protein
VADLLHGVFQRFVGRGGADLSALGDPEQPAGVMDMVFRDDECRVGTDHAPGNFGQLSTLRARS